MTKQSKKYKIHYDVAITQTAREFFKDDIISSFLRDGQYFNCIEIDPNGVYFFMKVEREFEGKKYISEISIPHHFVLYIISADSRKSLGF